MLLLAQLLVTLELLPAAPLGHARPCQRSRPWLRRSRAGRRRCACRRAPALGGGPVARAAFSRRLRSVVSRSSRALVAPGSSIMRPKAAADSSVERASRACRPFEPVEAVAGGDGSRVLRSMFWTERMKASEAAGNCDASHLPNATLRPERCAERPTSPSRAAPNAMSAILPPPSIPVGSITNAGSAGLRDEAADRSAPAGRSARRGSGVAGRVPDRAHRVRTAVASTSDSAGAALFALGEQPQVGGDLLERGPELSLKICPGTL